MRAAPPEPYVGDTSRRTALIAVLVVFTLGVGAIVLTRANVAHLGTLLVGCTALGTIAATALDRRTHPQTAKR